MDRILIKVLKTSDFYKVVESEIFTKLLKAVDLEKGF